MTETMFDAAPNAVTGRTGKPRRRWIFSWPVRREPVHAALAREVSEGTRSINSARHQYGLQPLGGSGGGEGAGA